MAGIAGPLLWIRRVAAESREERLIALPGFPFFVAALLMAGVAAEGRLSQQRQWSGSDGSRK